MHFLDLWTRNVKIGEKIDKQITDSVVQTYSHDRTHTTHSVTLFFRYVFAKEFFSVLFVKCYIKEATTVDMVEKINANSVIFLLRFCSSTFLSPYIVGGFINLAKINHGHDYAKMLLGNGIECKWKGQYKDIRSSRNDCKWVRFIVIFLLPYEKENK